MAETQQFLPDIDFIHAVKAAGGGSLKNCYQCATCSVVCALSPEEKPFPRKEMLWAGWGLKDRLISDPDVWLCHQCNDCSINCSRGAKPGDVLAAIRSYVFENCAFPKFMGKALADKNALFWLFLIPIILLGGMLYLIHGSSFGLDAAEVHYHEFFPHQYLEPLFIAGNILIFTFAFIGLYRFWNSMNHPAAKSGRLKFIPAFISTIIEFILHRNFFDCEANKSRSWGHILVFGGFIGAFITTGFVILFLLGNNFFNIPAHISHPVFEFPHPVKVLGLLSGFSMMAGGIILMLRRWLKKESVGMNTYVDWLFLTMIFLTALTGMLTYFARQVGISSLAYIVYFVHLVIVFFLLWYAPYSKFAHMFYRTLAITWAKGSRRGKARKA